MLTRYFILWVEVLVTISVLATALFRPHWGASWFLAIESRLRRWASRPVLCAASLFVSLIGIRLLLLPVLPVPSPAIHDEFSYLLAGDTYSSGRLTNAPHRFWESFESVHVLQQPTYMSMYPPLQGIFLALGWRVFGHPWVGVCLSVGFMVVAIYWMLLGWFSPVTALSGAALVAVRWGIFSYWMNSYWGGAAPAIGGALVLGSLPRLVQAFRLRDALVLALGICLLVNSRPYEGLVLSVAAIALLAGWTWRKHRVSWLRSFGNSRTNLLVPFMLMLLCGMAMLFYNFRVTGSAWQLPYVLDRLEYATAPLFVILPLRPEPEFRDAALRRSYAEEVSLYQRARYQWGLWEAARKVKSIWLFFLGPLLTVPFLAAFALLNSRDRRATFFALLLSIYLAGLLLEVWFYPHYAGPALSAFIALLMLGLRKLRNWTFYGRPAGLFIARSVPLSCFVLTLLPIGAAVAGIPVISWPAQWYGGHQERLHTASVFNRLGTGGQRDLVFVRYSATHRAIDGEWIANRADIDNASVVWARDKGLPRNLEVARYFQGRRIWLFEPDRLPWKLVAYDPARGSATEPAPDVR